MIPLDSVKLLVRQRLHVAAEEIFDLLERFITEYNKDEDTHWRLHTEPQHEDTHWRLHTEPQQQQQQHHTLLDVTLHTADQCVESSLQVKMTSPGRTQRQRRLPQHFQDFELASMKAVDGATDQPHEDLDPLSPPAQSALTSVSINSSSDQCVESRLQVRMNSPDPAATGFSVKKEEPEDHPHFIMVKEEVEDPERCEGEATDHGCRLPPSASTRAIDGATDQPHEDLAPLSPPAQSALTSVSNNSSSDVLHPPVCKEEVPPHQHQQMSSSPIQEEPESPWIKEEHKEKRQRPEEADWSAMTLLAVKSEDDVRETEPLASTSTEHMKTQAGVEYCGTSQPTSDVQLLSSHCSESDTEDIDEWEETREELSALNALTLHRTQTVDGQFLSLSKSSEQATSAETHTGGKIFGCTVCGKRFSRNGNLKIHTRTHTGEKPFSCTVCGKGFSRMGCLRIHWRIHTGEKPFSCPVCSDKHFHQKTHLQMHMRSHTGENPFSCSVCGKGFGQRGDMSRHLKIHTREKPFSCTICSDKHFTQKAHLQMHMRTHTGEKPFSCTVCGKGFGKRGDMRIHMMIHTG